MSDEIREMAGQLYDEAVALRSDLSTARQTIQELLRQIADLEGLKAENETFRSGLNDLGHKYQERGNEIARLRKALLLIAQERTLRRTLTTSAMIRAARKALGVPK